MNENNDFKVKVFLIEDVIFIMLGNKKKESKAWFC